MRDWVENLVKSMEKSGTLYKSRSISLNDLYIDTYVSNDSYTLFIYTVNFNKAFNIKIYQDEYDLLNQIINKIIKSEEDKLIELFKIPNFENASN